MQDNPTDSRNLFKSACELKKTPRPPIWIMRQAGRYLPEYRELKSRHSFLEIVRTPELAAEATLQPIRRFGFDCAILFSDILVVSEALGFDYNFKDGGGIRIEKKVSSRRDIDDIKARVCEVRHRLSYVGDALKLLRPQLPHTALLGFCGSPFTIAAYMVEGGGSQDFPLYKAFIKEEPELFFALTQTLSDALVEYAKMQSDCGADGFQIFDSHAAIAPQGKYRELSLRTIAPVAAALKGRTKTILFPNGMSQRIDEFESADVDAFSIDSSANLVEARGLLSRPRCLQGNLNPAILSDATPQCAAEEALKIVSAMSQSGGGHIFNLGHGIKPDAKLENVAAVCEAVKNFKA